MARDQFGSAQQTWGLADGSAGTGRWERRALPGRRERRGGPLLRAIARELTRAHVCPTDRAEREALRLLTEAFARASA